MAGVYLKVMVDGQMDAGAWSCGMVAGLIHDVPSVAELIARIMAEAGLYAIELKNSRSVAGESLRGGREPPDLMPETAPASSATP